MNITDPPLYCQRQIEGLEGCEHSCQHCWQYYQPVIIDRMIEAALEDWINSNSPSDSGSAVDYLLDIFKAGIEFQKEFVKTFDNGHHDDAIF